MSSEQTKRALYQLENEIATLEKKSADLAKKEATARINAANTVKSIPKNASISTLNSKQSQIQRYNDEAIKTASAKADNDKKIADKRKKRADTISKLQKEEISERKKSDMAQKAIMQDYEHRIDELTSQLLERSIPSINYTQQALPNDYNENEFDVFISHASEDKDSFVDELVAELRKLEIKVWYDVLNIKWGDSLRSKIDEGLKKSRFGIIVISKDYIKKFWTNVELDGLLQKENTNGKAILPIWHNISKKDVQDFSPIIAGRKAMNTTMMTATEIAQEFLSLLSLKTIVSNQEETSND